MKQGKVKGNDILLDLGSSCYVFRDDILLSNIRQNPKTSRSLTNGGHQDLQLMEYLPGFFPVWYNKKLMIVEVHKKFRITTDTNIATAMNVYLHNGSIMIFTEITSGLYIFRAIISITIILSSN